MSTYKFPDGTQVYTAKDVSKAKLRCETHDNRETALFSLSDDGKQIDFYLDEVDAAEYTQMLFKWLAARAALKAATLKVKPRTRKKVQP